MPKLGFFDSLAIYLYFVDILVSGKIHVTQAYFSEPQHLVIESLYRIQLDFAQNMYYIII
jgi:hypothetical protein